MPKKPSGDTQKVSDIVIRREFTVICDEHGVVASEHTYHQAVMARRNHWFTNPDHLGQEA